MALVPGLRGGLQERPEGGTRNTGRIVVTEDGVPRNQRLRPTASPIETYSRPAALPKNNDAERLMSALSSLNPALLSFGEAMKEGDKDKHAAINARLATMKAEDVRSELRDNPTGDLATSLKEEKGQELFAAKMAQDDVTRWQEEWATGAKDGVDVEEFLRQRVDARLKEHGATGQRFTNEYLRLIQPGMNGIRNGQLKHNIQRADEELSQGASALLERTIANGVSEGKKPDDIAAAVRAEIKGNKTLAGRDASWQEGEVLNIVQRYAEQGNVELVTALINSKGTNGFSLRDNREHGGKALKLLELADSKQRERNREDNAATLFRLHDEAREGRLKDEEVDQLFKDKPGLITAEGASALKARSKAVIEKRLDEDMKLQRERSNREAADRSEVAIKTSRVAAFNDGQLHRLGGAVRVKENGDTEEITAEKNKEGAVADWLAESEKQALRNKETPDQRFARELPFFEQNGQVHPEWKSTMSAGIKTISSVTAAGDKLPAAFVEGYKRYTELLTKSPGLLNAHLSKDERERWETMRVMVQDIGMDPSKAAFQYTTMQKNPTQFRELLTEGTRQDLMDTVSREFGSAANQGHIAQAIHKRAFIFANVGLSSKDALKRATEEYKRTHVQINGHYLDTSDRAIPPDFADLAKVQIDAYVAKHGKREQLDADDLTLEPVSQGTGAWVLRNVHTGMNVDNKADGLITLDSLAKLKAQREDAERAALTARGDKRKAVGDQIRQQQSDWGAAQRRARDLRMGFPDPARSGN